MKYAVITSQYMGDYQSFVIMFSVFDEQMFKEQMQALLQELEAYKRNAAIQNDSVYFGDFSDACYRPAKSRYVVNDIGGDYYVAFADTVNRAVGVCATESAYGKRYWPAPSAKNLDAIREHHSPDIIRKIVAKHFTLA